jgi:Ricin-type beta-trefoil lectin domain-like
MRGKRDARSRARGSSAARLTGAGLAILLAGAGLAAYLIVGNHPSNTPALPTRVLGTQAVGLVSPGPPTRAGASPAPQAFLASRSDLSFTAAAGQAGADWTADQMAGGTYIFIYLPSGRCLASARESAVTLARCNLEASQRWIRQHLVSAGGLDYWELRNLSTGRCLTAVGGNAAGAPAQSAVRLDHCQASPDWTQLVAFMTAS